MDDSVKDESQNDNGPLFSTVLQSDPDLKEVVDQFLMGLPQSQKIINNAYDEENWDVLKQEVHKIKGAGGTFGYPLLTDVVKQLHELLVRQKYDRLSALMKQLNLVYARIYVGQMIPGNRYD